MRSFKDSNSDGVGRLPRPDREARLPALARRRLPVGAAVLQLAAARRRLRRRRLHQHPSRGRDGRGLPPLPRRGAQARHARDHRLRDEPHQRRAPVVPGEPAGPRRALRRLLRVVRHRRALRGRARHLRRHRAVELDLGPGAPAVLLAPVLLPPAGPQLRQPQGDGGDPRVDELLARHGPRRLPARRGALPLRASRHQRGEPPRDPRGAAPGAQLRRRALPRPGAAGRGQPVAFRGGRLLRRQARPLDTASGSLPATSATCASTSR